MRVSEAPMPCRCRVSQGFYWMQAGLATHVALGLII